MAGFMTWIYMAILGFKITIVLSQDGGDDEDLIPDSFGRKYVVTFVDILHQDDYGPTDPELYISTLSNSIVTVEITTPHWNGGTWESTVEVTRGQNQVVQIPEESRGVGSGIFDGVFLIESNGPISVQAINKEPYNADGFTLYPINVLGKTYFAMTGRMPCIQAVAVKPGNTMITVKPTDTMTWEGQTYGAGQEFNVQIPRYKVWQYCHLNWDTTDLTGTVISSSNKIFAAFSGSYITNIADIQGTADHLLNQLVPVEQLGKKFALVGAPTRTIGDIFRVIGTVDGTQYTIDGENPTSLDNGEFDELDIDSGLFKTLESDQPIGVYHFAKSYDSDTEPATGGDPSLAYLPPLEQWANQHVYSTMNGHPASGTFTHMGCIVIAEQHKDGIRWNDEPLPSNLTWYSLPQWNLVTVEVPVPEGVHDFYHETPTVTFLVMEFGFVPYASYSTVTSSRAVDINTECSVTDTLAGDGLDNDCDDWTDEELPDGIDNDDDGLIDEDLATVTRVDGGWSNWTMWTDCGCDSDVETNETSRNRTCNNPEPEGYGSPCSGSSTETLPCNCSEGITTKMTTVSDTTVDITGPLTVPQTTMGSSTLSVTSSVIMDTSILLDSTMETSTNLEPTTVPETTVYKSTVAESTPLLSTTATMTSQKIDSTPALSTQEFSLLQTTLSYMMTSLYATSAYLLSSGKQIHLKTTLAESVSSSSTSFTTKAMATTTTLMSSTDRGGTTEAGTSGFHTAKQQSGTVTYSPNLSEEVDVTAISVGVTLLVLLAGVSLCLAVAAWKKCKRRKPEEKQPLGGPSVAPAPTPSTEVPLPEPDPLLLGKPNSLPPVMSSSFPAALPSGMRLQREGTRLPSITIPNTKVAWPK